MQYKLIHNNVEYEITFLREENEHTGRAALELTIEGGAKIGEWLVGNAQDDCHVVVGETRAIIAALGDAAFWQIVSRGFEEMGID